MSGTSRQKNLLKFGRVILAFVLLYFLFASGLIKYENLKELLKDTHLILVCFVLMGLQYAAFAWRWKIILNFYTNVDFKKIFKLTLIGQFFNLFVPGGVGGDLVKALELSKTNSIENKNSILSVFIDRFYGLYFMIIFSFFFLMIEFFKGTAIDQKYLIISTTMFTLVTLGLLVLNRLNIYLSRFNVSTARGLALKLAKAVRRLSEGLTVTQKAKVFLELLLASLCSQILTITVIYLVTLKVTDQPPHFLLFFPLACFAFMASSIPLTPGGIGIGQAAFYFIFASQGSLVAESVTLGISLVHLFNIIYSLPGAYFFITTSHKDS